MTVCRINCFFIVGVACSAFTTCFSAGKLNEGKHNKPPLRAVKQIDTKVVYQMPRKILIDGYNRFVILVPESEEVHW